MTEFWLVAWHWTCFNVIMLLILATLIITERIWMKIMLFKLTKERLNEAVALWIKNERKK